MEGLGGVGATSLYLELRVRHQVAELDSRVEVRVGLLARQKHPHEVDVFAIAPDDSGVRRETHQALNEEIVALHPLVQDGDSVLDYVSADIGVAVQDLAELAGGFGAEIVSVQEPLAHRLQGGVKRGCLDVEKNKGLGAGVGRCGRPGDRRVAHGASPSVAADQGRDWTRAIGRGVWAEFS